MKITVPVIICAMADVDLDVGCVDEVSINLGPAEGVLSDRLGVALTSLGLEIEMDDPLVELAMALVDRDDTPMPDGYVIDIIREETP